MKSSSRSIGLCLLVVSLLAGPACAAGAFSRGEAGKGLAQTGSYAAVEPAPGSTQAGAPAPISLADAQPDIESEISSEAREVATYINVLPQLKRLQELRAQRPPGASAFRSPEEISLRQDILEKIVVTMLEIHSVDARIDRDKAAADDLRAALEDRRDRAVRLNSITNFAAGGGLGVLGSALQIVPGQSFNAGGNIFEIIAGGISMGLSTYALKQSSGEKRLVKGTPNMLAKFYDQPVDGRTEYPDSVWRYVNAPAGADAPGQSRRQQLITKWVELGRLSRHELAQWPDKVKTLTGTVPRHHVWINLLADRSAMLNDLDALIEQMDRGLLELMLLLRRL